MNNFINKYILKAEKVYYYPDHWVEDEIEEVFEQYDIVKLKKRIAELQDEQYTRIDVYEGTLQRIELRSVME